MRPSRRAVLGGMFALATAGCIGSGGRRERVRELLASEPDGPARAGELAVSVSVDDVEETHAADVCEDGENVRREFRLGGSNSGSRGFTVVATPERTFFARADRVARMEFPLRNFGLYTVEATGLEENLAEYDVEHHGTTEVAGRPAEHVELSASAPEVLPEIEYYTFSVGARPPTVRPTDAELFFDEEHGFALREELRVGVEDGPTARTTMEYTDLEVGADVDPARFDYEPPAGATVRESHGVGLGYESVERAELDAGYAFHGPEAFAGWELSLISPMFLEDHKQLHASYHPEGTGPGLNPDVPRVGLVATRDGFVSELSARTDSVSEWSVGGRTVEVGRRDGVLRAQFAAGEYYYWIAANPRVEEPEPTVRTLVAAVLDGP